MSLFDLPLSFRKAFVAGVICLGASQGFAGEMSSDTVEELPWFGIYLGAQLGGAWGTQNWKEVNYNYFNTNGVNLLGQRFSLNALSAIGGGLIGVNYQYNNWLLGLEGAISALNLNPSRFSPFYPTDIYNSRMTAYATGKLRLGYIYDQWMLNLNGGYAGANMGISFVDPTAAVYASSSKFWANGWVVGIGLERKLFPQLILGVDYDYSEIRVNNQVANCWRCGTGVGAGTPILDAHLPIQTVMARLSYLFP